MKVSSTSMQVSRSVYIPYFKINAPIFCCPIFFEGYLKTQVRINKMGNGHTVDYHPRPSKLTKLHNFLKIYFSPAKRREGYGAEKITKIKFVRALVTRFDKFHHLCYLYIFDFVLLCHNLDSVMLKSESSLT